MRLYPLALSLIALAAAPFGGADETPATPQLEVLNVVALDGHGKPVTDLTIDDFEVTDSGKHQVITYFHHRDSTPVETSTLPPNEFSNRRGSGLSNATVILFDIFNERLTTRGNATANLVKYLEHLENADSLFLYFLTLDGKLYPVHGLPSAEVPAQQGGVPWTKQAKQLMDAAFRATPKMRPLAIDDTIRIEMTYTALRQVAAQFSSIPGRKNVVWITDGVPIELVPGQSATGNLVDFTASLRKLGQQLDTASTAIYPVRQVVTGNQGVSLSDSIGNETGGTGLDGHLAGRGAPSGVSQVTSGNSGGGNAGARGAANTGGGVDSEAAVDEFAALTGGRADTGKDIGKVVDQAMSDARTSYQIGYIPGPENWDDKLHKLHVTSSRKGVNIQAKTEYFAWRFQPGTQAEWAITSAATSLYDSTGIGLRAHVTLNTPNTGVAHVEAHIDGGDIAFLKDAASYSAELRIAVALYAADGHIEKTATVPLNLHLSLDEREKAVKEGVIGTRDLKMQANAKKLRFIVFDEASSAVGSVTIPMAASGQP